MEGERFKMNADILIKEARETLQHKLRLVESITDGRELKRYATEKRYKQFVDGEISLSQLKEFVTKRFIRKAERYEKELTAKVQALSKIETPTYVIISYWYVRSKTYGNNSVKCKVETFDKRWELIEESNSTASGCGYDKESASIGDALFDNESIHKLWYSSGVGATKPVSFSSGASIHTILNELQDIGLALTGQRPYSHNKKDDGTQLIFENQYV